jgi:hypothetical protein
VGIASTTEPSLQKLGVEVLGLLDLDQILQPIRDQRRERRYQVNMRRCEKRLREAGFDLSELEGAGTRQRSLILQEKMGELHTALERAELANPRPDSPEPSPEEVEAYERECAAKRAVYEREVMESRRVQRAPLLRDRRIAEVLWHMSTSSQAYGGHGKSGHGNGAALLAFFPEDEEFVNVYTWSTRDRKSIDHWVLARKPLRTLPQRLAAHLRSTATTKELVLRPAA